MENAINKTIDFLTAEQECVELNLDENPDLITRSGLDPDKIGHIYNTKINGVYIVLMCDGTLGSIFENGEVIYSKYLFSTERTTFDQIKEYLNECLENGNTIGNKITTIKKILKEIYTELNCVDNKKLITRSGLVYDTITNIYEIEKDRASLVLTNDGQVKLITYNTIFIYSECIVSLKKISLDDTKKLFTVSRLKKFLKEKYTELDLKKSLEETEKKKTLLKEEKTKGNKGATNTNVKINIKNLINRSGLEHKNVRHIYEIEKDSLYFVLINEEKVVLITKDAKVIYSERIAASLNNISLDDIKKSLDESLKDGNKITKIKEFLTEEKKFTELKLSLHNDLINLIKKSGLNYLGPRHIYEIEKDRAYLVLIYTGEIYLIDQTAGIYLINEEGKVVKYSISSVNLDKRNLNYSSLDKRKKNLDQLLKEVVLPEKIIAFNVTNDDTTIIESTCPPNTNTELTSIERRQSDPTINLP